MPGVTRDRREGDAHLIGLDFRAIDTAGYEDKDAATLPGRMRAQTEAAIAQADVALFMIDSRAGIVPLDEEIARWLRGSNTPIILVANKAEGRAGEQGVLESLALGFWRSGADVGRAWRGLSATCSRRCCRCSMRSRSRKRKRTTSDPTRR